MKTFLKAQVQLLLFWLMMTLLLMIVVWLYQMPAEAIVLTFCLSAIILSGFIAYRWHQYTKITRLIRLQQFDADLYPSDMEPYVQEMEKLQIQKRKEQEQAFAERKELMDYFSLWAHQTKLPLAVLQLLCSQDPLDTDSIRLQMKRLEQYITMAMAYIRLESASDYKLKNQPVDPILKTAIRSFSTEFIYKKIRLDYAGTTMQTITDSKWLAFVVEQILSNAIRYTPSGGIIRIWTDQNTLYIQDSGCGIDPADLPRIFDQGFSGFNGHDSASSSGIGLYLCKKVLDRLNHSISITSRLKKGTTVAIHLDVQSLIQK